MSEIVLKISFNKSDYVSAIQLHYERTLHTKRDLVGFVLFAIIDAIYGIFNGMDTLFIIISVLLVVAIMMILLVNYVLPRKLYKEEAGLRRDVVITFTEDEIRSKDDKTDGRFDWSIFYKAYSNEDLYLLYITKRKYFMVPKRFFESPEQESAFRDLLCRKIGKIK